METRVITGRPKPGSRVVPETTVAVTRATPRPIAAGTRVQAVSTKTGPPVVTEITAIWSTRQSTFHSNTCHTFITNTFSRHFPKLSTFFTHVHNFSMQNFLFRCKLASLHFTPRSNALLLILQTQSFEINQNSSVSDPNAACSLSLYVACHPSPQSAFYLPLSTSRFQDPTSSSHPFSPLLSTPSIKCHKFHLPTRRSLPLSIQSSKN